MFFKPDPALAKIEAISKKIDAIKASFDASIETMSRMLERLDKKYDALQLEEKIIKFHNEIANKYFGALTTFVQWNKEVALVSTLSNKLGTDDIEKLKEELLQPFYEQKFLASKAKKAEEINQTLKTKGEAIRQRKEELHQLFLKLQRENKDTNEVSIKLKMLEEILDGHEK